MYNLLRRNALHYYRDLRVRICIVPTYTTVCFHCRQGVCGNTVSGQRNGLNVIQARLQSTNIHTALLNVIKKKKKYKKSKKKYAELLEVTDSSTSETKASVSRLKAQELTLLVSKPEINLGELYYLKRNKTPVYSLIDNSSLQSESINTEIVQQIVEESDVVLDPSEKECLNFTNSASPVEKLDYLDAELASSNVNHEQITNSEEVTNEELDAIGNEKLTELDEVDDVLDPLHDEILLEDVTKVVGLDETKILTEETDLAVDSCLLSAPLNASFAEDDPQADFGSPDDAVVDVISNVQKVNKSKKETAASKLKPKFKTGYQKTKSDQMAKVKLTELEQAGKEACLLSNLQSYIDVSVFCGFMNKAFSSFHFYRNRIRHDKHAPKLKDVTVHNLLLQGYASKGNLNKVRELFQIIHDDKLVPTIQSYTAYLECLGRLPETPMNRSHLEKVAEEMKQRGFTFNDVFMKCKFVSDQRAIILQTLRRLQPDFAPEVLPVDTDYSCRLLQRLNGEKRDMKSPLEDLSSNEVKQLMKRQLQTEIQDYVRVKSIENRSTPSPAVLYYRKKLDEVQQEWRSVVADAFQRDLFTLRSHKFGVKVNRQMNLYPYLRVLDLDQYVEIIIQEIRKLAEGSETFSPTTSHLYREIGNQVHARYQVKYKRETGVLNKIETLHEDFIDWYVNPSGSGISNTREKWQELMHINCEGPDVNLQDRPWPNAVLLGIGKFMYNIIMRDVKIDLNITRPRTTTRHLLPAFYTLFRNQGRTTKEEVKPHPVLARLFRGSAQEELVFDVTAVPMLCPPLPWTSVTTGGYLVAKTDFIRLPFQAVQQWNQLVETPLKELYPSLDSLNQLGSVPWTINEPVLDTVIKVFNNGGSDKLDIPMPTSACPQPDPITSDMSKTDKYKAYRQRLALRRRKAEMYSLWCDALYRLSLANHFRKEIFWFPHNMDFRGRVYPCPPHLNHLGSDMARSILQFAKGEPLGREGLNWLKVHVVNLTGLKKKDSVQERLRFAEEMMPEIIDSAENPLTGRQWWTESDEPWQTLACCMEIVNALKSGDPENYICHFPVHQDGSCNGLQHYAALGRDSTGAKSVNLAPSERPQDVYGCVVTLVERERAKDAEAGLKIAQVLEGFVQRKVIKQTVMTTVYGVTRYGARLQIARQLKDIPDFPREYVWQGSTYLVMRTFESLREMFTSTKQIQDWFTECARLISQVCAQNVEWVTPIGLPIVQPYNKCNKKLESFVNVNKIREHYAMDMFERPNVMKQKNAFPPNFIHSLDSSHMMLTSLFCEREGITFVSVHDCFWTHPSTVSIMNKVCREQFVALHSEPILEDLSKFLMKRYSYAESDLPCDGSVVDLTKRKVNRILTQVPPRGDFQLNSVLDSIYFFS